MAERVLKSGANVPATHAVKAAGIATTAGGAAAEDITLTGVVATDVVVVTLHTEGSSAVTVDTVVTATDKITVTFSADPSTDHLVNYVVYSAAV